MNDFKMKDISSIGWYGNKEEFSIDHPYRKQQVDCQKLWGRTCLQFARTKYIPPCEGIRIGELFLDENNIVEKVVVSVDLMLNLVSDEGHYELAVEPAGV